MWACGEFITSHLQKHYLLTATFYFQVIFIIGSSFQCFAQHLSHIFVGRAIGGVGVGALRFVRFYFLVLQNSILLECSMLSPLYMAEISPPEVRGSLMALEQFSIVLGVVFGFWTGFATRQCASDPSLPS